MLWVVGTRTFAFVVFIGAAIADDSLSEVVVTERLQHVSICLDVFVGTFEHPHPSVKRMMVAQHQLGIIDLEDNGKTMKGTLKTSSPDLQALRRTSNGGYCIPNFLVNDIKVVKMRKLQGGEILKWDGAVAYATYTFKSNAFALRYAQALNPDQSPKIAEAKLVGKFLFKKDDFSGAWSCVAFDATKEGSDFSSQNVETVLGGGPLPATKCLGVK